MRAKPVVKQNNRRLKAVMTTPPIAPTYDLPTPSQKIDWLSVLFTLLALALGVLIAFAVKEVGALSLLAIPALLVFFAIIGQPDLGLAGFIFITLTQLSNVGIQNYGLPSIAQPLAALLILLIILRITLYGEQPVGWLRAAPILVVYVLIWLISLLHAADYSLASDSFFGFVKDALGAIIIIFLIQRVQSYRVAFWTLIITGLFMAAITSFQGLTGAYNNDFGGFGQITLDIAGEVSRQRLSGPYSNANAYAQVLVVIAPIALDRLWHEKKLILRLIAGMSILSIVIAILYTYSRNGFITLLFSIGLLFAQRRPNIIPWIVTAALALGVIQFLPDTFSQRLSTLLQFTSSSEQLTDPSFRGRYSENLAGWRMFLDHPVLGVGLGNYRINYQEYSREIGMDSRRVTRTPANLYLELLSEQGLIGTTVFFILMFIVMRNLLHASRQFSLIEMQTEAYMATALIAGFAGYMFAAINKNSAYSNVFWVIIGIMLATVQVAQSSFDAKIPQTNSHPTGSAE